MSEVGGRMLDGSTRPDEEAVAAWIGATNHRRWRRLLQFIEGNYPGVFPPDDWLFGGKKHGWGLRFKKSKSFCTLIPERNRLVVLIVFGAEERQKAEAIMSELSADIRQRYSDATTYHDGKWLVTPVDNDATLADIEKLLFIKRKPKQK